MVERTYYIYRHIRLDKNVPFYIGKGATTPNAKSYKWEYRRAFYGTETRNEYWKRIVNITPYEVEIIFETHDSSIIDMKEKEFIKLYGRKGYGTLCNLTDGGDGWSNPPQESIEKAVKKRIENGSYANCSISNSTPIYLYNLEGKLVREFKSIRELKKITYIDTTTAWQYAKTKRSIYNYLLSYEKHIDGINPNEYNIPKNAGLPVLQTTWDGSPVKLFKTINLAETKIHGSYHGLKRAINLGFIYRGYYWENIDILQIQHYINHGVSYVR